MKRAILPLAGAMLFAILAGFQYFARESKARQAPPADLQHPSTGQVDELRKEMQALRSEVRESQLRAAQVDELAAQRAIEGRGDAAAKREPSEAELALAHELAHEHREAYIGQLQQSFHVEPVDRKWAAAASSEIDAVLHDKEVGGLEVKSVECRASACRVELPFDGTVPKGLPIFLNRLGGSLPNTIAHPESDGHGGTNTVIFMYRAALPPDTEPG
jgi:hypothetical protein